MNIRHSSCIRCLLTCVAVTLLAGHSVWSTSHPSTLNLEVTDSSKLHQNYGVSNLLMASGASKSQISPLSFLSRRRRHQLYKVPVFYHHPQRTHLIILVGQGRVDRESQGWSHPRDQVTPAALTLRQAHRCEHGDNMISCLTPNYEGLVYDPSDDKHGFLGEGLVYDPSADKHGFLGEGLVYDPSADKHGFLGEGLVYDPSADKHGFLGEGLVYDPSADKHEGLVYDPSDDKHEGLVYDPSDGKHEGLVYDPSDDKHEGLVYDPSDDKHEGLVYDPSADKHGFLGEGLVYDPSADKHEGLVYDPSDDKHEGLVYDPSDGKHEGLVYDPSADKHGFLGEGLVYDPSADKHEGLVYDPSADKHEGLVYDPSADKHEGLVYDPSADKHEGLVYDPSDDKHEGLVYDPSDDKHGFLARAKGEGLMPTARPAKLMFEKKKQKKAEEIHRALNKRYNTETVPMGTSENSLLKERKILDELVTVKNILRKKQGRGVAVQWLNDISESSEVDKYLWKPWKSLDAHLTGGTDDIIDNQRLDKQRPPHDGTQILDGQVLDSQVLDGHALNIPLIYPLAYSAGWKLPASGESFHETMDSGQAADMQSLTPAADHKGQVPSDNLQYSTFNDALVSAPPVSRHNEDHVSFPGIGGNFLQDTTDCHLISTKNCLSDLECSCSGFYVCDHGRCTLLTEDGMTSINNGWMNDPTVVWMDGPTDEHGFLKDPVGFGLVGADTNGVTEKPIWHNEPFDFSQIPTAAGQRQPTDAMFWPVNPYFMEPQSDNIRAAHELEQPQSDNIGAAQEFEQPQSDNIGAAHELEQPQSDNIGAAHELEQPQSDNIRAAHELEQPQSDNIRAAHELEQPQSDNIRAAHELEQPQSDNIRAAHELEQPQSDNIRAAQELEQPQSDNIGAAHELEQPIDDKIWSQGASGLSYLIQGSGARSRNAHLGEGHGMPTWVVS